MKLNFKSTKSEQNLVHKVSNDWEIQNSNFNVLNLKVSNTKTKPLPASFLFPAKHIDNKSLIHIQNTSPFQPIKGTQTSQHMEKYIN